MVLAGTAKVHAETILHLRMLFPCYTTPLLNELRGGDLHGLSPQEIETQYPEEHMRRQVRFVFLFICYVAAAAAADIFAYLLTC